MKHEEFTAGTATEGDSDVQNKVQVSPVHVSTSMKRSKKSESAFRTISEVADELGVQQHVLRFWETKFTHVKPLKRGGGRRYYRPEDVDLLRSIQHLLYTEGYTIKGVQKLLKTQGKKKVLQVLPEPQNSNVPGDGLKTTVSEIVVESLSGGLNQNQERALRGMLGELKALRSYVASDD